MASSHRSPKELKEFIEKANAIEWHPMESSRRNETKVISKHEYEILQARIEEQSRLIMYYKQRGDDYLRKNQSLEKLNLYLTEQKPFKFFRIDSRKFRNEAEFVNEMIREAEKTEIDVIKSRTDEQANLVAFYKNRGDESVRKSVYLEKLNQDLKEQKEQTERDFENLNIKYNKKK